MLQKDVYKFPHMPVNPDIPPYSCYIYLYRHIKKLKILHLLIKVIQPCLPLSFSDSNHIPKYSPKCHWGYS